MMAAPRLVAYTPAVGPLVDEDGNCQDYRHPFGTCPCWEYVRRYDAGLRAVLQWKLDRDGELP